MRGMNHAIPAIDTVRDYLTGLQDRICAAIEAADGHARFVEDAWRRADDDASTHLRGGGRTRVLREIRITLLHEIGHHFGLDEGDLERLGYA